MKMKSKLRPDLIFISILIIVLVGVFLFTPPIKTYMAKGNEIKLPEPNLEGEMNLEEALLRRRSIRDFSDKVVPLNHLSQILWASQGITSGWGGRTAPSAGALYPLEVYVQVKNVEGLNKGVYQYNTKNHSLTLIKNGDFSSELMEAGINQESIGNAALNIVITADFSRTTSKYGERGVRYVYLEAGHSAQNIYLQVTALNLGCVTIGAFVESDVKDVLSFHRDHEPIYIIPVGYPS